MSHIHIPDGVLPIWIVALGWAVTSVVLYICIRKAQSVSLERKLPLIGIMSALMIVGMTLEIVPIAYHINMSVIAGIVLGPVVGFIAVFIVNLIIAMFGHGGITVVGLNTLIVGSEAVLGFYLFHLISGAGGSRLRAGSSSAVAAAFSLLLSVSITVGVVYASEIKPDGFFHSDGISPQEGEPQHSGSEVLGKREGFRETSEGEGLIDGEINIGRFAKMVFFLGIFGWILESVITGFVIGYISRVRPGLVAVSR